MKLFKGDIITYTDIYGIKRFDKILHDNSLCSLRYCEISNESFETIKVVKRRFKPYLSLDIETTGLDHNNGCILEIGLIYDDLITPIEDLPQMTILVKNDDPIIGDAFAFQMNQKLIREIEGLDPCDIEPTDPVTAISMMMGFIKHVAEKNPKGGYKKLTVAGKNAGGFDIPWLRKWHYPTQAFDYKILDVGPMFYDELGKVAGLEAIKKHCGIEGEVTHRALDDAIDVVKCIRFKLGIK